MSEQHQPAPMMAPPGGLEVRMITMPPPLPSKPSPAAQRRADAREATETARRHFIEDRDHDEIMRWTALDKAGAILRPTAEAANYTASQPDDVLRLAAKIYDWAVRGVTIPPLAPVDDLWRPGALP